MYKTWGYRHPADIFGGKLSAIHKTTKSEWELDGERPTQILSVLAAKLFQGFASKTSNRAQLLPDRRKACSENDGQISFSEDIYDRSWQFQT